VPVAVRDGVSVAVAGGVAVREAVADEVLVAVEVDGGVSVWVRVAVALLVRLGVVVDDGVAEGGKGVRVGVAVGGVGSGQVSGALVRMWLTIRTASLIMIPPMPSVSALSRHGKLRVDPMASCATKSASTTFTRSSPLMSPHRAQFGVGVGVGWAVAELTRAVSTAR
jgi:hypothetical protein